MKTMKSSRRARTDRSVFIVHGRDVRAAKQLRSHLHLLGLKAKLFEEVATRAHGAPMVASVVRAAISDADAVIVLLTPDEHAIYYETESGRFRPDESRWQSRPNVIFEAGWAYGSKPDATLFVSLGEAEFFSDIAGHVVTRLDRVDGLTRLRLQLQKTLGIELKERSQDVFKGWDARRPAFHDEMSELTLTLSNKDIALMRRTKKGVRRTRLSLMVMLREAVRSHAAWDWSRRSPRELVTLIELRHGKRAADDAFWWFASFGVFRFGSIEYWGDHWKDAVDTCHFAPRGLSLIRWLGSRRRRGVPC